MNSNRPEVSIVIPVFNAKETLKILTARIKAAMDLQKRSFELILVNDGSSDSSWDQIQELAREYAFVRGIDLMRNYGQHNALLCGIREAKSDIIVTMDDDLQHPPETIHILLETLEQGYDVVYGAPITEKHGLFRDTASLLTKIALRNVMKVEGARHVSAYRAFRTYLRESFAGFQGSTVSIDVLLSWGTANFSHVKVDHRERISGASHYTLRKLIQHAMNMMTGYSTLPLRISSGIGFVFTIFGFIVFLYAVIRYLIQGGVVPGFTFLASLITIFSGAQLFALGIIGEYLARMHFRLMDKPSYAVKSKVEYDQ